MKDQFVPYELAVKLKELGFYEECIYVYSLYNWKLYRKEEIPHNGVLATPLWQQAFDWFRESFNIDGEICCRYDNPKGIYKRYYTFVVYKMLKENFTQYCEKEWYNTYEQARYACLEKLIELASPRINTCS